MPFLREERSGFLGDILWDIVIPLVILWVVAKLARGIAGALFYLLLFVAMVVNVYVLINAWLPGGCDLQ